MIIVRESQIRIVFYKQKSASVCQEEKFQSSIKCWKYPAKRYTTSYPTAKYADSKLI